MVAGFLVTHHLSVFREPDLDIKSVIPLNNRVLSEISATYINVHITNSFQISIREAKGGKKRLQKEIFLLK